MVRLQRINELLKRFYRYQVDGVIVTSSALSHHVTEQGIQRGVPVVLISDGRLIGENLRRQGYERRWLDRQLAGYGLSAPSQAFLFTVDRLGNTYCVAKEGGR